MRRKRYRKQAISVSLFPFLAVLVCTMGSLIVLLVLVVQQARVNATEQSITDSQPKPSPEELEELQIAREDIDWRREILEEQRAKLTARLANRRMQLGHLEEHIRQLKRTWEQLQQQHAQLQQLGAASRHDSAESDTKLQELQRAIQAAENELARLQQQASETSRSFAIIPYDGPHGTRRRPIYVECTETGIVLQPEGIRLTSGDFEGPTGPGNPLDAALRTVREHLARTGRIQQEGEPYPLLIVRPRGTLAYLVARDAMKSWDDEFGYELVDAEMKLKYPKPDPVLKEQLARAVADARQRQTILAQAMPSRFKGRSSGKLSAPRRNGSGQPFGAGRGSRTATGFGPPSGTHAESVSSTDSSAARREGSSRGNPATGSEQQVPGGAANGPQSTAAASAGGAAFSLAESRGANWALRNGVDKATGITRPIRVACLTDRLVILPQRGEQQRPFVVDAPGPLSAAIDEFVSAIWKHTEQWGIAVAGGYWMPVLNIEVAPGAESRFQELMTLLQDSGLDAKRTSP